MPGSDREQQFLKAEHLVELDSAELKKDLRLGDLVLSQILYIAGLNYFGTAGRLGSSHVMGPAGDHPERPYVKPDSMRTGCARWREDRLSDLSELISADAPE